MIYCVRDGVHFTFPFTDQTTTKKRPALVISSAPYNDERPDIILMAVTSQVRPTTGIGEAMIADWEAVGLIKPSVIKPIVTTIEKRLVIKTLGQLKDDDRKTLGQCLDKILGE